MLAATSGCTQRRGPQHQSNEGWGWRAEMLCSKQMPCRSVRHGVLYNYMICIYINIIIYIYIDSCRLALG